MNDTTHLRTELCKGVLVATIKAESLSEYEAGVIQSEIDKQAPSSGWSVVLDFSEVRFVASSGIGMIIAIMNSCKKNKGRLVVCSIGDDILAVLKMTKVDKLFKITSNRDKAIAAAA